MTGLIVTGVLGALAIVAVVAVALNPSPEGIGFALIVVLGACCVWLLHQVYLAESDHDDR